MVLGQQAFQFGCIRCVKIALKGRFRAGCEQLLCQHAAEQLMHAVDRVAHRHGTEGITVIAVTDTEHAVFAGFVTGVPILDRHLQRHFHGNGAGIGNEHPLQGFGRHLDQLA